MDVWCSCGKFMGTVLEGSKLRIGWVIQCKECEEKFMKLIKTQEQEKARRRETDDLNPFKNLFGDIFK